MLSRRYLDHLDAAPDGEGEGDNDQQDRDRSQKAWKNFHLNRDPFLPLDSGSGMGKKSRS
jgi:hypothetical protein